MWLAPLLIVVSLGSWAFASPIGSAPDDDFHLTSTWCANSARTDLCKPGPTIAERIVPPAVHFAPCYAQNSKASAACLRGVLSQGSEPSFTTKRGSFENNYPPVYYAVMNVFAGPDVQVSAIIMRFFTIILFAGITTALYVLLPVARRSSLVWGWLITTVPLGVFLIASNNPSSWAIIGVGTVWLALVGYFETTGGRQTALGAIAAVAAIMAAGSRGDAAIYTVVGIGIAVLLTFRKERAYYLASILPVVLAAVSVAFFLASRQSTVAVGGLGDGTDPNSLSAFALLAYNLLNVQNLWAGVFGSWGLGWLDTSLPAIVSLGSLATFIGVAFTGIASTTWRKTLSAVGLGLVLWLLPTYVLVAGSNIVGQNVQPRYLLPLIVIMGGLAVLSVAGRTVRVSRFQGVFVVASLAIAQSVALEINIRRYVTGSDVAGVNLDVGVEWWWDSFPFSPMAVWILGSLAFTALITILVREMAKPHELTN